MSYRDRYADSYDEMTDTQQSIVDALAECRINGDDCTNAELADDVGCSKGYLENIKHERPEVVEKRVQVLANKDSNGDVVSVTERGNVSVEGDIDLTDLPEQQTITERPVSDIDEEISPVAITDGETIERLETIAEEITAEWMHNNASPQEAVAYLAMHYFGEVEE